MISLKTSKHITFKFFARRGGKITDHALGQLTSYLIESVTMFKDYPFKAIEEIASRLD